MHLTFWAACRFIYDKTYQGLGEVLYPGLVKSETLIQAYEIGTSPYTQSPRGPILHISGI